MDKFYFIGRDKANDYLKKLLSDELEPNIEVVDFTTYSLKNLLNQFKDLCNDKIDIEFLMNRVIFEIVTVDKVGDAEQFFIDLNDGLDLKEYEIFKAELNHKIKEEYKGDFKSLSLALDNEWLNFFLHFKNGKHCEEEIEIDFIKFCFRMMYIEENGNDIGYDENDIEWIENKHIYRIEDIMDRVIKLDVISTELPTCVNYSFGELKYNEEIQKVTGVYWKLDDNNYDAMLHHFILNVCDKDDVKNDVLIWQYISKSYLDVEKLNKHLRFVKILLNNNRVENSSAYFYGDKNKNEIWFTKYNTYGIPNYYKILKLAYTNYCGKKYEYGRSIDGSRNDREKEKYICAIIHYLSDKITQNEELKAVLINENKKYKSGKYLEIEKIENLYYFNGLVDNVLDDNKKPLVSYDWLRANIKSISELYDKISNIVTSFDCIVEKNLDVKWRAYTDNYNNELNVQLVPQCLCDFFTNNRLNNIIKSLIKGVKKNSNGNEEIKYYLKLYKYLPPGWIRYSNQIYYPDDYYAFNDWGSRTRYKGLCSINGKFELIKISSAKYWFMKNFKIITLNENNDMVIYYKGKESEFPSEAVVEHKEWLTEQLLKGKYKKIYYSTEQGNK